MRIVRRRADVAFLFLGEMLLGPHLWPIVDALAAMRPELSIDIWVSTSTHEALVRSWISARHDNIRIRRAPGFKRLAEFDHGRNPPLPYKIPLLLRLARYLSGSRLVVCAEQTSLWLPRLLPGLSRFIFTVHGAGPINDKRDGRLKCAHKILIPSPLHTPTYISRGVRPERIVVTGYAKSAFQPSVVRSDLFAADRPILLYTPHWRRNFSSWWDWGADVAKMLADQRQFNVVIAPHQRLFERDPGAAELLEKLARYDHVHVDCGSFAMVDGSYTQMADIYLGDSSSQVVEYLARPRPAIFLDSPGVTWRGAEKDGYWDCGDIVTDPARLWDTILAAKAHHPKYEQAQRNLVARELGETGAVAPRRSAEAILAAMSTSRRQARIPALLRAP